MIETVYSLASGNQNVVEKVVMDENVHYVHMIFNKGEGLPKHLSNSNVYMTVIRGLLSLSLDGNQTNCHTAPTLLKIPQGIEMHVRNEDDDVLELIVVKAPAPQ